MNIITREYAACMFLAIPFDPEKAYAFLTRIENTGGLELCHRRCYPNEPMLLVSQILNHLQ
ncbi:hypothetical protein HPULCUR_009543 [Helicostylum pulchrum]|uniref:Uncharacterized protein n=1 Tax=Helicostylum pulchrum TaxID=562976 RepID=A0ABP9YAT4_9FUNG